MGHFFDFVLLYDLKKKIEKETETKLSNNSFIKTKYNFQR